MRKRRYESMQERIIACTVICEHCSPLATPCWIWMGTVDKNSYHGRMRMGLGGVSVTVKPHRISYEAFSGKKVRKKQVIRHKCDNPQCCNPEHLEPGTQRQNCLDTIKRNRHKRQNQHTKNAKSN